MTADNQRNEPRKPPLEEEPHEEHPIEEPVRDDAGWERTSPDRPPFTGSGEPDEPETSDDEAGTAENVAAGRKPRRKKEAAAVGAARRPKVEATIEVDVPVHVAYDQWTQFEDFPKFMDGVERVDQLDDKTLRWVANIGGKRKEWIAEIAEQQPDRCIAWHSTSGVRNAGRVDFEPLGNRTRLRLIVDYDTETALEAAADAIGLVRSKIEGDLQRFKTFIENRPEETGAWRGRIHGGREQ